MNGMNGIFHLIILLYSSGLRLIQPCLIQPGGLTKHFSLSGICVKGKTPNIADDTSVNTVAFGGN